MSDYEYGLFDSTEDKELICRGKLKQAFHESMEENQIMPGSPDYDYFMDIINSVPAEKKEW